jgi:16S rRNA (cytosine1402-N4)-methyltransferase
LRIAVNDELGALQTVLKNAPKRIKNGGVMAVISFHSLEDRMVKNAFRDDPRWNVLTNRPLTASGEEVERNPRARSAKLRAATVQTT